MNSLTVYKASAGSGKTFTLAIEYLELLIRDITAYRRTLAVTFTNKATAEMKNRILSQLYGLAHNLESSKAYKNVLKERNPDLNDELIQSQAAKALKAIIHDYSRFRVETIDSFFQRIMKQLAHELKLSASFNIELDSIKALGEAVDSILEDLHNDKDLLKVIISYIEEQLSNNKNWKIESGIKNFARHIFDEAYERESSHPSYKTVNEYKKVLLEKSKAEQDKITTLADKFFSIVKAEGLEVDDFKSKEKGPYGYFLKLSRGNRAEKDYNTKTYIAAKTEKDTWYTTKAKPQLVSITPTLMKLLNDTDEIRKESFKAMNTIDIAIKNLNNLSLFGHISRTLIELNDKHNRFLLSDTNNLLRKMIGTDDPSFIYEKIGTFIEHIMIDEFQDTSSMQWENFSKLLKEGLAQDKKSLIVGDVKQSIYRWRGGDWNILNSRLPEDISPFIPQMETLNTNRRSAKNIIDFNNTLFPVIIRNKGIEELTKAYSDVKQEVPKEKQKAEGYVKITELNKEHDKDYTKENYVEDTIKLLADDIKDLVAGGLPMKDICILVRTKEPMQKIARYFSENLPDISLVSEEAFRVDSSEAVCAIIAALRYLDSKDDSVARIQVAMFCLKGKAEINEILSHSRDNDFDEIFMPQEFIERYEELQSMPLYELTENLMRILNIYDYKEDQAHICFFLDSMKKFMQEEGADIESFLKYWDETLQSKTISGGATEGVRIMTIHASKGLQAHTILIPFCDWAVVDESYFKAPIIWCRPPEGYEYKDINILPVTYSRSMENSEFSEAYANETMQMTVDNINLLYVALTRAEKNLYIYTKIRLDDRGSETVGDIIINAIGSEDFAKLKPTTSDLWEFGSRICKGNIENNSETDNPLTSSPVPLFLELKHSTTKVEFRQSNKSTRFQEGEEPEQQTYINKGVLMHRLFSSLVTGSEQEIDSALAIMEFEGLITSSKEKEDMKRLALGRIGKAIEMGWFDKRNRLYNECKLLYNNENGELEQAQPDRVIVNGNNITVIDFKFGKEKDEYREQVKRYINILHNVHFGQKAGSEYNIKGFLWYVYSNNIIEVE